MPERALDHRRAGAGSGRPRRRQTGGDRSGRRITYRELDVTTRELAAVFVDAGVRKGARVGLIMPNSVRWVQLALP